MNSNHHNSFLILISVLQIFLPHVTSQASPPPGYQYADFNPSIITIIVILIAALFLMALFTVYIRRQSYDGTLSIRRALSTRRPTARGLDASVIDTFPTFVYSTVKPLKIGKGALECAVCLNEYEDEETLRLIPKCDHVFHPECIDAWLQSHVTCPVCRADLLAAVPEVREPNDDVSENNVVVDIQEQVTQTDRDLDREDDSVKLNSPSIIPRVYFERFRSHSTGHSVVQPGENMERFTLRLPADVRKQVVNRALLNRERSGKSGYRTGGAISGRRKGFKRLESLDRVMLRSERWVLSRAPSFLSRALSFRSPRVVSGNGEASTSSTTPKMVDKIPLNNFGPKSC